MLFVDNVWHVALDAHALARICSSNARHTRRSVGASPITGWAGLARGAAEADYLWIGAVEALSTSWRVREWVAAFAVCTAVARSLANVALYAGVTLIGGNLPCTTRFTTLAATVLAYGTSCTWLT